MHGDADSILAVMPDFTCFADRLAWLARQEEDARRDVRDHADGVAHFSVALAEELGFTKAQADEIRTAARWHDIGKLATPEGILRKRGRHEPAETVVMRRHAMAGVDLLGPEAPDVWRDVAAYHHERYDGFGYAGLKGEDIPLAARIVNIADVHDALIQQRDYKAGMSEEKALLIMTADIDSPGFGRRAFDPALLRIFVSMRLTATDFQASDEGRKILEEYALSNPMDDIPGGWEANDGWLLKRDGHRVKYETAPNGNKRMAEMRKPTGEMGYPPEELGYQQGIAPDAAPGPRA